MSEANRIYFARDVYRIWKRRVAEAEECITVYTPFFDMLLIPLLGAARIDTENITIVTDLNPSYLLDVPRQLHTLKRALSDGITVLSTPNLHARVLLTLWILLNNAYPLCHLTSPLCFLSFNRGG